MRTSHQRLFVIAITGIAAWGCIPLRAASTEPSAVWSSAAESQDSREDSRYQRGARALDERRWDRAVEAFDEVIQMNGSRKDGALYWKAYAQSKQGLRAEALSTLDQLLKGHPNSRWLNDAKVLDVEIRQASGQPVKPEEESDEELKLIALNSLMHTDSDRALSMLETFLKGNQSPKLKERALFVLSQSGSARSREVLAQIARGASNPDLQLKAIRYLGLHGGKESRQTLSEIYAASNDSSAKKAILQSFMVAGDKERLLAAARSEQMQDLRLSAIQLLGVVGAQAELWDLYKLESAIEVREKILRALFVGGNSERLIEVAKTEKDPRLRLVAIRQLGTMGSKRTGDALVEIYEADKDADIRKSILQGLFVQGNAKALVALARKETDSGLKKEIVSKLSIMKSPEAVEYLMEILNK